MFRLLSALTVIFVFYSTLMQAKAETIIAGSRIEVVSEERRRSFFCESSVCFFGLDYVLQHTGVYFQSVYRTVLIVASVMAFIPSASHATEVTYDSKKTTEISYEAYCLDGVEYLRADLNDHIAIFPHFLPSGKIVTCKQ